MGNLQSYTPRHGRRAGGRDGPRPGLAGCSAVAVRAPRLSKLGTLILQLFGCFAGILGEAGPRPRTGDTMICSLGRYVYSRFCQLQNPPREAELLLSVFPDVSHRCFGLVSKLVSNENPPVSTALSAPGLYVWLNVYYGRAVP